MADNPLEQGNAGSNVLGFLKNNFPAVAVITIVLAIVLPMPTVILDALMAINLIFSLMILLSVLSTQRPTELTLFPTFLLVSTVFSLALNVSSARLILTQGSNFNGRMIKAFSSFVVGSAGGVQGIVVGTIIFIIIILVQVIVITKGATRVSEVAARFTLDSMPVKMMAVDTEYSSGAITEEEARSKKAQIQMESDFYGSMDGASKFISGNVKVGVFIIIIEMLGGFIVNSALGGQQSGISVYIALAIGDGLVTQLPALLVSTAMAIIVTRAAATGVLADQIVDQILKRDSSLYWVCAAVVAVLGFLPGFPWYLLFPMAALIAFHAYTRGRAQKKAVVLSTKTGKPREQTEKPAEFPPVVPLDALSLELGYGLVPLVEKEKGAELLERVMNVRSQSAHELGLVIPKVRIIDNSMLNPSEYCFKIKGVDSGRGKIRLGYYLCINPGMVTAELQGEKTVDPAFGIPAIWIEQSRRDEAERAGYTVVDPPNIIATHLTEIIRRHAAEILGLQDTQVILDTLKKDYPAVVEEAMREGKGLRVTEIQKILHGLLRERVSIRNLVSILEAIADYAPVSKNIWFLTEKARQALANQICGQYADEDKKLRVLTIDPALEQRIIDAKYETASGMVCALDPPTQKAWIKSVAKAVAAVKEKGWMPVILCSEQARFLVKNSTDRELPDLAVLSVPEIVTGIIPEAVGMIRIEEMAEQ